MFLSENQQKTLFLIADNNQNDDALLNMEELLEQFTITFGKMTYPTFLVIKEILKQHGLINCENGEKREIHLTFTEKGKRTYELLKELTETK